MKDRRTGEQIEPFGYRLDSFGRPLRQYVAPVAGDYGSDPLPDGTFRMHPSGDVVSAAERARRLGR